MGKLPEDVAERRQNPALLVDVVGRGCDSGALDGTKQATIHFHIFGPACDAAIEFPGIALCTNGLGNRHCEQRAGLPTNRMRMSDRRVLARPLGHPGQIMVGSKDTQWANGWNSTRLPSASPASWPRRHPWARVSRGAAEGDL